MTIKRVLGIDPGLDRTGWAVLDNNGPAGLVLRACGLIHTDKDTPLPERLDKTYKEISKIADEFHPDTAAMEQNFFTRHSISVSQTIQTRGVILLALHQKGLDTSYYLPKSVKLTICGSGSADKKQVQRMVQLTLKLKEVLNPDDVADAAAIAICHFKTAPVKAKINAQQAFLQKIKEAQKQQIKKIIKK